MNLADYDNVRNDKDARDYPYLVTMDEVLTEVLEYAERARDAQNDVQMDTWLRMTAKSVECALRIFTDHLADNRREMQLGEKVK